MKIVATLLLFCCFLTSCAAQNNSLINENGEDAMSSEICYEEGIYSDKNWDMIQTPIERDCIPDKETAIQIAKIFLLIESRQDEAQNLLFDPTMVFYDIKDMIWIVSFSPFQNGMPIPGDSYNIALRRNNAEVVKMWAD